MAEQSKRELAEGWLENQLAAWQQDLRRLKIGHSEILFNSFHGSVIASAGDDVMKLALAFAWYGSMVDAGFGRGHSAIERSDKVMIRRLLGSKAIKVRKAKPWFTKGRNAIAYQTHRLAELLGGIHADIAVEKVAASIDTNQTINLN